jgi:hypothetical protein
VRFHHAPNKLFDTDAQVRPRDRSYSLRAGQLRRYASGRRI